MILFQDAIALIKTKDRFGNQLPFAIEFVTANAKTKHGGDIIEFEKAIFIWPRSMKNQTKKTDHFLNGTIDIKPLGGKKITRVHLQLIRKINNKVVA